MTTTENETLTNSELMVSNAQLLLALKDTVATLMALSTKYRDGMGNLVGTSVYNARKVISETEGQAFRGNF